VILNGLTFVVAEELGQKWQPKKEKREQAPAFQMEYSTSGTKPNG
jgi:hypothetical protein